MCLGANFTTRHIFLSLSYSTTHETFALSKSNFQAMDFSAHTQADLLANGRPFFQLEYQKAFVLTLMMQPNFSSFLVLF